MTATAPLNKQGKPTSPFQVSPEAVAVYQSAGLQIIPLLAWNDATAPAGARGKRPKFKNWAQPKEKSWKMPSNFVGNIGWLLEDRHLVVDVDPRNFANKVDSLKQLEEVLGFSLDTVCNNIVETGSGGLHFYFKKPYDLKIRGGLSAFPGIDFKTKGTQVVAAGSKHANGKIYAFTFDSLSLTQMRVAPKALLDLIARHEKEPEKASDPGDLTPDQLAEILDGLPVEEYRNHDDWVRVMLACHWATAGQGLEEFIEWSTEDPKYSGEADRIAKRWESCSTDKSDSITTATLIAEAHKHGHYIDPRVSDPADDFGPVVGMGDFSGTPITAEEVEKAKQYINNLSGIPKHHTPPWGIDVEPMEIPEEKYGKDAVVNASMFCRCRHPGGKLIRANGDFYSFDGTIWNKEDKEGIAHDIQMALLPFHLEASQAIVSNTIAAVKNMTVRKNLEVPCWIAVAPDLVPDPKNLVVLENGIIDLNGWDSGVLTPTLYPHTKRLFTTGRLDFKFDPQAECPHWIDFLKDIWSGDAEQIRLLQQWMGYNLVYDYRFQKIMLFVGLSRSGKGTIEKIMARVLGEDNVAALSMHTLSSNFGLQHLVGKKSAVAGDAHKVERSRREMAKERLLGISSLDKQVIDQKNKDIISVRLPTRITLIANEMPPFVDNSDALLNRLLVLSFSKSYAGREDVTLAERLLKERAGIFNWAIKGLEDLGKSGGFLKTTRGEAEKEVIRRINNPISGFLEDCCRYPAKKAWSSSDDLYRSYCAWMENSGNRSKLNMVHFFKTLKQNAPTIERVRGKDAEGQRVWGYKNILLTQMDGMGPQDTEDALTLFD